mgnify:FL=1
MATTFAERMAAVLASLKPCPFCGDKTPKPSNIVVDDSSVNDFSVVFCTNCKARGPEAECWESAADEWTKRSCTTCDGRGCKRCNPPPTAVYAAEIAQHAIDIFLQLRQRGYSEHDATTKAMYEIIDNSQNV